MTLLSPNARILLNRRYGVKTAKKPEIPPIYAFERGKIPDSALNQGYWWRDKSGKPYIISSMNPIHAQRALVKLFEAFSWRSDVKLDSTDLFKALVSQAGS